MAAPAAAGAIRQVATTGGFAGANWQVVVGPTLPRFPGLVAGAGRAGPARALRGPLLLAVTTLLTVVPALTTATPGAGTLAWPRLGLGLLSAAVLALAPRLGARFQVVATVLPLLFVVAQVVAAGTTAWALVSGDSGLGAAIPHLVGAAATLVVALRGLTGLRGRAGTR